MNQNLDDTEEWEKIGPARRFRNPYLFIGEWISVFLIVFGITLIVYSLMPS